MLQLTGHDWDLNLRATDHPEFDAWRWNDYWVPLDAVVEFKRDVYQLALTELARFLPRMEPRHRYLRAGQRAGEERAPERGLRFKAGLTFTGTFTSTGFSLSAQTVLPPQSAQASQGAPSANPEQPPTDTHEE